MIVAILALLLGAPAWSGMVPATILGKVAGPRALALGDAAGALENDPTLIWDNPSSSARTAKSMISLGGQRGIFGQGQGQIVALKVTENNDVLGFGLTMDDAGSAFLATADGTTRKVSIQRDFLGLLGYSRRLGSKTSVGVAAKLLRSELLDQYWAHAFMADAGVITQLTGSLKAGVAVQNLGTNLRYAETSGHLPTSARGGLAYGWAWSAGRGLPDLVVMSADGVYSVFEQVVGWRGGLEFGWRGNAVFRLGYRGDVRQDSGLMSAGVGFAAGRYRMDYGIGYSSTVGYPQSLSLTFSF